MKKLLSLLLLSLLSFSIIAGSIVYSTENNHTASETSLQTPRVFIDPQNGTANVGEQYTIAVKVADVTNLYGFVIQIRWGTAVLRYVSHDPMAGETGGVLNSPYFAAKDVVDETASIELSTPGTTYWYAALSMGGAVPFSGNGTFFTMTFQVLRDGECDIYFTMTQLSDPSSPAQPIAHTTEDAYFYRPGLVDVPAADFTFTPDPAVANKTTTFDASGSSDADGGTVALYIWNFKDGTIVNTTSPSITHTFTTIPLPARYHDVELTVLDDQGGGSQSKAVVQQVYIVHPRPVALFAVWPEDRIAVVNKTVTLNASESYDPDPGGTIVQYRWDFGDGNLTDTSNPVITHVFQTTNDAGFTVKLVVLDDSDGLESIEIPEQSTQLIRVVQRRDIEVADVTTSSATVRQGEDVEIDVTVANKGEARENFNLTAYYNTTMTEWIQVDETSISNFQQQYVPKLEFMFGAGLNATMYHAIESMFEGFSTVRDNTKVRVGAETGYWTLNPGLQNTDPGSPALVAGMPLSSGGWIWEEDPTGSKKLNGEFAAGNWTFRLSLYATQGGVNATMWARILKSSDPDPQADGATITVVKNWTALFPAAALSTTAKILSGTLSVPSTVFTDEYVFFEFQLQVTANTPGNATTDVVFRIGGASENVKSLITGSLFSYRNRYTLLWNTGSATPGNHVVKVETTPVPHETDLTNNVQYSSAVQVAAELGLTLSPVTGFASVTVTGTNFDPNSVITITWDGTAVPTVPQPLRTNGAGSFTALISVPTQTAAGAHTVAATDEGGNTEQATFTVIDMTGSAGATGATGPIGPTGPQGPQGEVGPSGAPELSYAAIILALIALALSVFVLMRKR
jgi:hypothetical protein